MMVLVRIKKDINRSGLASGRLTERCGAAAALSCSRDLDTLARLRATRATP